FVREIPEVFRLAGLSLERVEDSPEFVERLAVGVHELWRRKRASQGWTEETDPQMVDYERLPESSKELNRKTARTIVDLLKKYAG
ncbi:MAG: RyR domain-containing protein, partial [Aquificaceae bacterium]|nr:RyR domain-containing protein [Aquificaceae bacterium]